MKRTAAHNESIFTTAPPRRKQETPYRRLNVRAFKISNIFG
jgi:hypothetical protein